MNNVNKFQQGGQAQKEMQIIKTIIDGINQENPEILQQLSQLDKQQQQQVLQVISQLAQQGDASAQQAITKLQGGKKAKLGAKLNYVRKIKGLCPEDEELVYMKKGGRMCPVCQKKAQKAEEGDKLEKETDPVKKFKCGRKVKKAEGGNVLGLKGKINEYNEPDPKNPQKVLYDDHGNSVIREKGYFIKRKELSNNKIKDDTIQKKDPRYIKIETEFNKNTRN